MIHIVAIPEVFVKVVSNPESLWVAALVLVNKRRKFMEELILIVIYCVLGTVLMLLGSFVVDLVIPCQFPTEIKNRNVAVGSVMAGIFIAIGIIISSRNDFNVIKCYITYCVSD